MVVWTERKLMYEEHLTHTIRRATAVVVVAGVGLVSPAVATAAPPIEKVHSTAELPVGEYKVNFFVRDSYDEPVTNVAEIELEFSVTNPLP
jgi:hypothetical protein